MGEIDYTLLFISTFLGSFVSIFAKDCYEWIKKRIHKTKEKIIK